MFVHYHYYLTGPERVEGGCGEMQGMPCRGGLYRGEWRGAARHGHGRMRYPDGRVYEGGWTEDKYKEDFTMLIKHETLLQNRKCADGTDSGR